MSKILRKLQKIFGATSGVNEIGVVGSFAAGVPAYSTDPDVIQSLSEYGDGWFGCILGQDNPSIEDANGLDFLTTRQLAYLMQAGVPEWDAGTTYYIGSLVNDGAGNVFISAINTNLNQPLTSGAAWKPFGGAFTTNLLPLSFSVASGQTYSQNNPVIGAAATVTVNAGGFMAGIGPGICNGTIIMHGTGRVL